MSDEPKKKRRNVQGKVVKPKSDRTTPKAKTPDGREKQLITLAMDLAEKQLREGTATSQVITHFLKLGGETEALTRERLRNENQLVLAKVDSLKAQGRQDELFERALRAMTEYSGEHSGETDEYDEYD